MARISLILVAILLASWSLLVLTQKSFDHEFGATFTALLLQYDKWSEYLVEPIAWLVRDIANLLREWWSWPFELHPYWKHILVVLTLYMSNYISNNVRGRLWNAIFLAFFLPPLAILGAGGLGIFFADAPGVSLVFPILALILFAVAASIATTFFYPPGDQSAWLTFRHYWSRTVMPFVVLGGLTMAIALVAQRMIPPSDMQSLSLTLLAAFVLGLALNLLARGPALDANSSGGRSLRQWLTGSFGPRLGSRIVGVYGAAAGQLILDAYVLRPLGF